MRHMIPFKDLSGEQRLFVCRAFRATPEQLEGKEFAFVGELFDAPYHFYGERKPVEITGG